MVIIQKPQNLENYVKVSGKLVDKLQDAGFYPLYKDEDGAFYFIASKEVKKFIRFRKFF